VAVAAPAAFSGSPNSNVAANVVGVMLIRWHYLALLAPLLLFALEWRRNRPIVISLLFSALILAATQGMADLRIRALRDMAPRGMSALDPSDPLRRHFGMLHGMSMMLMALQVALASGVVLLNAKKTVYGEVVVPETVAEVAVVAVEPEPVTEVAVVEVEPQPVAEVAEAEPAPRTPEN
jgi:hypothetical protein